MKGLIIFILILPVCFIHCDNDRPADNSDTLVSDWEWVNPLPQGNNLKDIWVFSEDNFIAVGDAGTILRYSNSTFSLLASNTTSHLYGIWAVSADNIFAVGEGGIIAP